MIYIKITFLGGGVFFTVSLELSIKYIDQTYITEIKNKCSLVYKRGSKRQEGHKDSSKEEEFKSPKLLY